MAYVLIILFAAFFFAIEGKILKQEVENSTSDEKPITGDELIEFINQLNTTWKAGWNPLENITYMTGALPENGLHVLPPLRRRPSNLMVPKNFDSRKKWSNCQSIRKIRNQGRCGSCWAFAAVEAMSDRICIHSAGKKKVQLSAEDLLSCCHNCGYGCKSGYADKAWQYWVNRGIVSGGEYKSNKGCRPYTIPASGAGIFPTPKCIRKCEPSYPRKYKDDLHRGSKVYSINDGEKAIKQEIFRNGPVEGCITMYEDFHNYQSGVYQHEVGKKTGLHNIKIIGWGVENGTPYWLIANSWGSGWGQNGFGKIKRGSNECGIENKIYAGIPK